VGWCFFFSSITAHAQIDRASLTGTVTDASGAVIPEVKIDAVAVDTPLHYETLTNKQGTYRLTALPVGNMEIDITNLRSSIAIPAFRSEPVLMPFHGLPSLLSRS
jgi:carboxypeptidase family protein